MMMMMMMMLHGTVPPLILCCIWKKMVVEMVHVAIRFVLRTFFLHLTIPMRKTVSKLLWFSPQIALEHSSAIDPPIMWNFPNPNPNPNTNKNLNPNTNRTGTEHLMPHPYPNLH
jgi:hypothetical protein